MKTKASIYNILSSLIIITCLSTCGRAQSTTENKYSWTESDTTLALSNRDRLLWQYNFNTQKGKPFFHPINIDKTIITALSPADHPWHLGLWFSWKYINGINYWEYDESEGVDRWNYAGVTKINNKTIDKRSDFSSTITLDISYRENNLVDVLHENRTIEISPPVNGEFYIDYTFTFTAIADTVELNRTPLAHEENGESYGGYAGLSLRFNMNLDEPNFINPDSSSFMKHGETFNWMYYGLHNQKGERIGTAIFDHPQNINHPSPWHLTNTPETPVYFLQPAPIFYQPITLYAKDTLTLKYRVKFFHGDVNPLDLEKEYEAYLKH